MLRSLLLTLSICVAISGCQSTKLVNACAGSEKLTPSLETSVYILKNDRPFSNQVAVHNQFGSKRGCWK